MTARGHIANWALWTAAGFVLLFLMAYLDHQHPETETAAITAQIDHDLAAEHAAVKGTQ